MICNINMNIHFPKYKSCQKSDIASEENCLSVNVNQFIHYIVEILIYDFWFFQSRHCWNLDLQNLIFFQSRKSEDDVLRDVLRQIAEFLKADDTERARKLRQTGTSGNEMAQIFEQLANSEVHFIYIKYK